MPTSKRKRNKPAVKTDLLGYEYEADRLIRYLQGETVLHHKETHKEDEPMVPPKLQEKLDRVIQTRAFLMEHRTVQKVVEMLQGYYHYSMASAYRDVKLCEKVFGNLLQSSKDTKRQIAEEMILESRKLAIENKDTKSLAAIDKNYIQLHNLDKEDSDIPDLSNFQFQPIIVAIEPGQVGLDPPDPSELEEKYQEWMGAEYTDFEELEEDQDG